MTTRTEYYLSVSLKHPGGAVAYAGNHDEFVSTFLTGVSSMNRTGYAEGLKDYQRFVSGNVGDVGDSWDILFQSMSTDYGLNLYQLDPTSPNNLYMKFDNYLSKEDIVVYLKLLWKCVGGEVVNKGSIYIDGFTLVTQEVSVKREELF